MQEWGMKVSRLQLWLAGISDDEFMNIVELMATIQNNVRDWDVPKDSDSMKVLLTHLPLDKMATILSDDIFKCIFLNENDRIPIKISLKFVPRSPIDNKPVLVQVMAWRRIGDKPLSEPMLT